MNAAHTDDTAPTLAATVIPIRTTAAPTDGRIAGRTAPGMGLTIEILMIERQRTMSFAAGAWVFPGGRVEDGDVAACRPSGRPASHGVADLIGDTAWRGAAERIAAVRELREEAGLIAEPSQLVRVSHWTPPPESPKRFSTAFFAVAAPGGPVVLDGESASHRWVEPRAALAAHAASDFTLTPPTFITLVQLAELAAHPDVASAEDPTGEVLALVSASPTEHFATRIAAHEAELVALYHGDAGYELGEAGLEGPRHRLRMSDKGWQYQRDVHTAGPPVPSSD